MRNASGSEISIYEEALDANTPWAMNQGGLYLEEKNEVFITLRRVTGRLNDLGIPYAVAGTLAMFRHGVRMFTEIIEILIRSGDLEMIQKRLVDSGEFFPACRPRRIRDSANGVEIRFLITGSFPVDGKPKPVAFPDPAEVAIKFDGVPFLDLRSLIELMLASGVNNKSRLRDLADTLHLIDSLRLTPDFSDQLDPYVPPTYLELWDAAQTPDIYL